MDEQELSEKAFREAIDKLIEDAPPSRKARLRGLQSKCDMIRRAYGTNHLGAAIEMSKMMMGSLYDLNEALHDKVPVLDLKEGKVLDFKRKDEEDE